MRIDVLDKGYVRLVDTMGSDLSVVNAARVSYDKEVPEIGDKDAHLLKFLWKHGHTSPFRHAVLSFEVYAPLMVARQWYKHAVASTHTDDQSGWNESSRRYVTESEEFYIPEVWRLAAANSKQGSSGDMNAWEASNWTEALKWYVEKGESLYQEAMDSGIAPEMARLFLPANGLYVRWRWTVSLHSVLHFLELRKEHTSQKEIQNYAKAVETIVWEEFPVTAEVVFD